MTKLFSLISQTQVEMAPGQKIVSAQEFTILESAEAILKKAEEEAIVLREEVTSSAKEKGFQEGLHSLNKHLLALDRELKTLREEIQKKILPLALTAAKKLLGEELRLHPDRIVDIVMTSLKPVTQHRKVTIYVNKADLHALEQNKPKIKEIFDRLESFSLQERNDVEPGGCMIETEAGIINAQLENQWRALETAFAAFMKKE